MTPPRLDEQFCFALYAASQAVVASYGGMLSDLGITFPQYLVLMVLWERDDLTVGQLGQRLHLNSGTLTPLLKRLQKNGLVLRARDPEDERRVRVTLTERGRGLGERAATHHDALLCQLGDGQRQALVGLRDQLQDLTGALRSTR